MTESTKLVHRAIDLSEIGDNLGAVSLLSKAVISHPQNPQAFFERGMALLNLNRDAEALADFDRALSIDPEFPGARDWRARARESLGDHRGAAEDRLKLLRSRPDGPYEGMGVSPQDWAECAEAFCRAGDRDRAIALLQEYFARYAKRVTSYSRFETAPMRVFARLMVQTGEPDRALEFAGRAYDSQHQCPMDVLVFALVLEASNRPEEALTICQEAMEINDQMPGVRELYERLSS